MYVPSDDVFVLSEVGVWWRLSRTRFITALVRKLGGLDVRYSTLGGYSIGYVPDSEACFRPSDWSRDETEKAIEALQKGTVPTSLAYKP